MPQYLAWGQYFWFFVFVFRGKAKKTKNKKAEPMSQHLACGLFFVFLVSAGFCNILVSDMGSAILFCLCFLFLSRFLQFSGI